MKRGRTNLRTALMMMIIITIIITIITITIISMIPSQVKATLLGALFLIDFMYFEQQQNNNNDWKYTFEKHNYGRHANPQWLWKETKILKITKNYGIHAKYWKSPMIMKGMQNIETHQWKACKTELWRPEAPVKWKNKQTKCAFVYWINCKYNLFCILTILLWQTKRQCF